MSFLQQTTSVNQMQTSFNRANRCVLAIGILGALAVALTAQEAGATGKDPAPAPVPTSTALAAAQANAVGVGVGIASARVRNTSRNDNRSSASSGGNTLAVSVEGGSYAAQERNPVSTAYAPALTTSNGTCSGSTSAGAQGASLGLSFGTTWTDAGCDVRYDAQALAALGLRGAAIARLCQKPEIAKAMGSECPSTPAAPVAQSTPAAPQDLALR